MAYNHRSIQVFAIRIRPFRPSHITFAVGADLDETFGLIETVEKAALIYSQIIAQGGQIKQRITDDQLKELAQAFGVEANPKFLA